jgi:hypothetical protein
MVNTDVMVGGGTRIDIPVSCVERGRWRVQTAAFRTDSTGPPTLRRVLTKSVSDSYRSGRRPTSDQTNVWDTVDSTGQTFHTHSPTANLSEHYEQRRRELAELARSIPRHPYSTQLGHDALPRRREQRPWTKIRRRRRAWTSRL